MLLTLMTKFHFPMLSATEKTVNFYVHLVSKAAPVITSKSPASAFRWSGIYYTANHRSGFTDKMHMKITFKFFHGPNCQFIDFMLNL